MMSTKCFICKCEIKPGKHVYNCAKKHNITLSKNDIKFEQIKSKYSLEIKKQDIVHLYVDEEWSLPDFQHKFGFSFNETLFLLKYFLIPIRTASAAKNTSRTKHKFLETSMKLYGVPNPSSSIKVKNKRKNTFQEKYGVDNVRKSEWFKKWLEQYMIETYSVKSLPNRYGNMNGWWDLQTEEFKKNHMLKANEGYKSWYESLSDDEKEKYNEKKCNSLVKSWTSSVEQKVKESLLKNGIDVIHQFWINRRSYDFRILETNILIEVNGDYWHANPSIYSPEDILSYPDKKITALEKWEEDKIKIKNANEYGYKVITIWESDVYLNQDNLDEWIKYYVYENQKNSQNSKNLT